MSEGEAISFIASARRALRSHLREMRWSAAPDDLRGAMDAIIGSLCELAEQHPQLKP